MLHAGVKGWEWRLREDRVSNTCMAPDGYKTRVPAANSWQCLIRKRLETQSRLLASQPRHQAVFHCLCSHLPLDSGTKAEILQP